MHVVGDDCASVSSQASGHGPVVAAAEREAAALIGRGSHSAVLELKLLSDDEGLDEGVKSSKKACAHVVEQMREYFKGTREDFDLELKPEGTPFQRRVWKQLLKIPYGKTTNYGEIARRLKRPTASRAVGHANGMNPIWIVIPCHRVIGKNGSLTGYGGGLENKQALLELEGAADSLLF